MSIRKIGSVYYLDVRINGQRIRKRASTNRATAQKIHDELLGKRDLARFGIAPDNYPLGDLKEKFLEELRPRILEKTLHDYTIQLDMGLNHIGEVPLNTVRDRLNQYINYRADQGISAKILNRTIGLFKRMLSYGVQTTRIPFNPLADMPLLKERHKPRRSLTLEEIERLLAVSGQWRPIWLCFITTGLRKSELVRLRWQDIDEKVCTLIVRESKTDAGVRAIPVAPTLRKALQALRKKTHKPDDYVFHTQDGTPLKNNLLRAFRMCYRRAGINQEGLDLHALRYTFATLLTSRGVQPKHVQSLLGHKSALTSLNIYTKVFGEDLRHAVERIEI